jgi:hypothetical protein
MAEQPPQQKPSLLQDTTAATIKALTDKINRLESGGGGGGGNGRQGGYRKMGSKNYPRNNDGIRTTRRWDNDNYCWTCGYDIKHTKYDLLVHQRHSKPQKGSNSNQHHERIHLQSTSQSLKSLEV